MNFINRFITLRKNLTKKITSSVILSQRELVLLLQKIPFYKQKIINYKKYKYYKPGGVWIRKSAKNHKQLKSKTHTSTGLDYTKVHYGCGINLLANWLNTDLYESEIDNYKMVNILEKHPFKEESIKFGFAEDVMEHLNQAESIFFLAEVYRTLDKNGVLRLSFPGLEGVLKRHYSPPTESRIRQAEFEAYAFWDHVHFYSKEEIILVAKHIGFKQTEFVKYGQSIYPELCGLDTRSSQIGLNTYIELTK